MKLSNISHTLEYSDWIDIKLKKNSYSLITFSIMPIHVMIREQNK